jgi:hypothetical protein
LGTRYAEKKQQLTSLQRKKGSVYCIIIRSDSLY